MPVLETTAKVAHDILIASSPDIAKDINKFTSEFFRTRGGRIGSGMGLVLESLWGYFANKRLENLGGDKHPIEVAWISTHEYNDFACVVRDSPWALDNRESELLRIEAKSMLRSADESKAHFDELVDELSVFDVLLVLIWDWEKLDDHRVVPQIVDFFIGNAAELAKLRDALHLVRGGSFVHRAACPDHCNARSCSHHGEPLNASGTRERPSGPVSSKGPNTSFAANFGGLVRMLKTSGEEARSVFRRIRRENDVAHSYISFIHRNLPAEEINQYLRSEWVELATNLNCPVERGATSEEIRRKLQQHAPHYQDVLRTMFK